MGILQTASDAFYQCFLIPTPALTEKNLPNQSGRVHIVTGGYAGCGKELSKLLYQKNATVYVAGRSQDKGEAAIEEIKKAFPSSDGKLEFLKLDLADLPSIKGSAESFMKREQRLDVLTNNAGVMTPPVGSKTEQGHELQHGTKILGPFLFTKYLTPILQKTASSSPPGSVRVTWAASLATLFSPRPGGVIFDEQTGKVKIHNDRMSDYAQTKAANALLAREYQARYGDKAGIISNAWNPGNLQSELQRHQTFLEAFFTKAMVHPVIYGGYTELFAACSEEAGREENKGKYIGPWGRFVVLRDDVAANQGGAKKLWEWCEAETKQYS